MQEKLNYVVGFFFFFFFKALNQIYQTKKVQNIFLESY